MCHAVWGCAVLLSILNRCFWKSARTPKGSHGTVTHQDRAREASLIPIFDTRHVYRGYICRTTIILKWSNFQNSEPVYWNLVLCSEIRKSDSMMILCTMKWWSRNRISNPIPRAPLITWYPENQQVSVPSLTFTSTIKCIITKLMTVTG